MLTKIDQILSQKKNLQQIQKIEIMQVCSLSIVKSTKNQQ